MLDLSKLKAITRDAFEDAEVDNWHLANMSPVDALDSYLKWHGIIGYTNLIVTILDDLRGSEQKNPRHEVTACHDSPQ